MNSIIGELGKNSKFCEYIKNIEDKKSPISISGLTDVGMVQMAVATNEFAKKPICILTYNEIQAKKIIQDIKYFTDNVVFFPKKEIVTYDYVAESKDLPYERIETLNKIYDKKNLIVVTTIEATMQKMISKEVLYKDILEFKVGDTHNFEEIKQKLINLGYSRCELIEGRGQFSIRGGILDISINETFGIRIEFWGDEVDSIRHFNIISQRSTDTLDKIKIYPAHEYILENSIEKICKNIEENIYSDKNQEIMEQDIELIKNGDYISKIDKYFNSFYQKQETLLNYLNENYIIYLDEISKIENRTRNVISDTENVIKLLAEKEKIIPEALKNTVNFDDIFEKIDKKQIVYIEKQDNPIKKQSEKYKFNYREVNYLKSGIELLFDEIKEAQKNKKKIYILAGTEEKAKKLSKILDEKQILSKYEEKLNKTIIVTNTENIAIVTEGKLSAGFECYDLNELVIVADELIEGEKKKRRYKNEAFKEGEKVVFADLKIGICLL